MASRFHAVQRGDWGFLVERWEEDMDRLDLTFTEKDSVKMDKPDLTVTSEKTQQVKKMFEQIEEKSPKIYFRIKIGI